MENYIECTCHLMSRKCKLYYYQPASDFICEACLTQPIVTLRKHRMREDAAPLPPATKSLTSTDSSSGPSFQPWIAVRSSPRRRQPQPSPSTNACNSVPSQQPGSSSKSASFKKLPTARSAMPTKSTRSSEPTSKSSLVISRASPTAASLSSRVIAMTLTTDRQPPARRTCHESSHGTNDDNSWKSTSLGDSSCWEAGTDSKRAAVPPIDVVVVGAENRLEQPVSVRLQIVGSSSDSRSSSSSSHSSRYSRRSSSTCVSSFVGSPVRPRQKQQHRRIRRKQQPRRWRPVTAARPRLCTRRSRPRQRDPPHQRRRQQRSAKLTSPGSSFLSSTTSSTGRQHQSNVSAADNEVFNSPFFLISDPAEGDEDPESDPVLIPPSVEDGSERSEGGSIKGAAGGGQLQQRMSVNPMDFGLKKSEFRKAEQQTMVEKAIMDFFSTHKGDSAPRVLPELAEGNWATSGARHHGPPDSQPDAQLAGSHLLKDSIVFGETNVFEQCRSRQFILPMFDRLLDAFFADSSFLRAACTRTGCRVELSRRILNRRVLHGSWIKYMVITIAGPTNQAIENCDRTLKKCLPAYRLRRLYDKETTCCLYLNENTPDNAELCFSHQRTGVATTGYGNLKLRSPFFKFRRPWSAGLIRYGRATVASKQSGSCVSFVYANALQRRSGNVPAHCTGVNAISMRQTMHDAATEHGHAVSENRKRMLLTLNRV